MLQKFQQGGFCRAAAWAIRLLPAFALVVACGGCGDGRPARVLVKGRVTVAGRPLTTGTITFSPKEKNTVRPAIAYIREDGAFEMTTFSAGDGVQPGDYRVSIIAYDEGPLSDAEKWTRKGKKLIPEKYFQHRTSGLEARVPENDVTIDFDLEPNP